VSYADFYGKPFGKRVLEEELAIVEKGMRGCSRVLSVGCGQAFLEARLARSHPDMAAVGLDSSKEMLAQGPGHIEAVLGDAGHMPFEDGVFDGAFYVTSLEFIDDYRRAIEETERVLGSEGRAMFLMLNPRSRYFQGEYKEKNSYIRRNIKRLEIEKTVEDILRIFSGYASYEMGIKDGEIHDTKDPEWAALYVAACRKR